jgi:hypothetical protein
MRWGSVCRRLRSPAADKHFPERYARCVVASTSSTLNAQGSASRQPPSRSSRRLCWRGRREAGAAFIDVFDGRPPVGRFRDACERSSRALSSPRLDFVGFSPVAAPAWVPSSLTGSLLATTRHYKSRKADPVALGPENGTERDNLRFWRFRMSRCAALAVDQQHGPGTRRDARDQRPRLDRAGATDSGAVVADSVFDPQRADAGGAVK